MKVIGRQAFETLRTERLSATVPWVGPDTYAQVASWAVWAEVETSSTAWSRDTSVLTWEQLGPHLHSRVVFVALNKGTNPVGRSADDWSNFHSGRSDYKLARAIARPGVREVLEGAYLTDFFKGLPTPTTAALKEYLDGLDAVEQARTTEAMVTLLERELEILGCDDPLLVGIGRDAERWLRASTRHDVVGITHYAHAIADEVYGAELAQVARAVRGRPA